LTSLARSPFRLAAEGASPFTAKEKQRPQRRKKKMRNIHRHKILSIYLFTLLIILPLFSKPDSKYNVCLITIDTLRPDRLSCYNRDHLITPNIDKLAERGILFSRAFAHTPTTLPSHTNIFLGTIPPYHGVHDNANFVVEEEFLTLAEHLKKHGYATAAFVGAFPLDSRFGLTQGFDLYDDNYGSKSNQEFSYVERRAEVVVEKALHWLKEQKNHWFIWVHCFDPHQRYAPPEPFKTQYRGHPYEGEVAYVDSALGKFFDYLDQSNLMDETLIILTADHGESLGQHGERTHGYFAYNATLWVPLIIYYPAVKPGRIDQSVCHTDIFPSVCDILGMEKPSPLHGLSLLPPMKGKKLPERLIYFESLYPFYSRGWAPLRGFIQDEGKYIDSPIPEFYDLERDFDELENLASAKGLKPHKKILERFLRKECYLDKKMNKRKPDREALQKLRSLGYAADNPLPIKSNFTEKDDLKILLPYQNRLMKAMRAYDGGRFEESIRYLREIIAERKDLSQAYSHLAKVYKEQRKLKEALEILSEGLENNPSSYKIMETYGMVLTEVGEYDKAVETLKNALNCIDYDPEIWNYLGVAYWKKGDFQNAYEAFTKVLSLDENYPVAYHNLGALYLSKYIRSKNDRDFWNSILNYKKALELDPSYAEAYNGLGTAYGRADQMEAAIHCWEKAVELNPDYVFPFYNLGIAYLSEGEANKALTFFSKYKKGQYHYLSSKERAELDSLIEKIKKAAELMNDS
jgi:arylsulfatase A-like enzyme/Flp pilus assembly protein TadD